MMSFEPGPYFTMDLAFLFMYALATCSCPCHLRKADVAHSEWEVEEVKPPTILAAKVTIKNIKLRRDLSQGE